MMLARRGGVRLPAGRGHDAAAGRVRGAGHGAGRRAPRSTSVDEAERDRRAARCGLAGGAAAARRGPGPPRAPGREHPRGRRRSGRHRPRLRRDGGDGPHAGDRPGRAPRVDRRRSSVSSARSRRRPGRSRPDELAATVPYLQPLALSAATRKRRVEVEARRAPRRRSATPPARSPSRSSVWCGSGPRRSSPSPCWSAPSTCCCPSWPAWTTASRRIGDANYGWLALSFVMSILTYVASAIGLAGGVTVPLPFVATVETQLASSFVNRVSPANVGGMALNVRYLQKVGRRSRRGGHRRGSQLARRRHRPRRAAGRLPRLGRPRRRDRVLDPVEQQGAGRPGGRARAPRDRVGDPAGDGG